MKKISSFKNVINNYDYFLFDQWGVLHNGYKKFLEAEKCLEFLKLKIKIKKIREINKFLQKSKKEIENFFDIKIEYLENRSIKKSI